MTMHEEVQHYYGNVLQGSADLKTDACCTTAAPPPHLRAALAAVHEEVRQRYYGCGLVVPPLLDGLRVLDLGCGAGQDCYVLAQLVGPEGAVVGVDMTTEQLAVAERHRAWHAERFGYANVEFRHGYIERLAELGLADNSFDLIVSNCVINLVPDKAAVLREARRLLKPGGELYFSDVYADRRVPAELAADPVLYGECLGGALYWNDFLRLAHEAGFADPRLVEDRPLAITNDAVQDKLGNIRFHSATCRLFKLDGLEPDCEDYGQAVRYRGSVPQHPYELILDKHHVMETGRLFPVCGNTWRMLHDTRFREHFDFYGDFSRHYGLFPGCGCGLPFDGGSASDDAAGCCC
jgi:SAM-dependent methyltransferase